MTIATINIGALITQSPDICGGRPRITGTGVTVQRIVTLYRLGLEPSEIASEIEHLSLAQVHAALAYYHANRGGIDQAIDTDNMVADDLERKYLRVTSSNSP